MPGPGAPITLLSDFGTADPFVGVMKGVILGIHPLAVIVDLTHHIPPQDIETGAYHLSNAWGHFPLGTVHVAVVDPGVGSSRRALAVEAEGHLFVAPDNGLLTPILDTAGWRAVALTARHYMAPEPSATFHGRDIFAHAAAHLSRGIPMENLGEPVSDPVRLETETARLEGGTIRARVVHVDRFGSLVLNVRADDLARAGVALPMAAASKARPGAAPPALAASESETLESAPGSTMDAAAPPPSA